MEFPRGDKLARLVWIGAAVLVAVIVIAMLVVGGIGSEDVEAVGLLVGGAPLAAMGHPGKVRKHVYVTPALWEKVRVESLEVSVAEGSAVSISETVERLVGVGLARQGALRAAKAKKVTK